MPHGGRKGRRPGHSDGGRKQRTRHATPAATEPPPETLVQPLIERLGARTAPAEVAAQIVAAAPGGALMPLLDALAPQVDEERFVVLLADLLGQPLDAGVQEHVVALLERTRTPLALETLVALGEQEDARVVRPASRRAPFRLRNAGVAPPEPEG